MDAWIKLKSAKMLNFYVLKNNLQILINFTVISYVLLWELPGIIQAVAHNVRLSCWLYKDAS